MIRFLKGMSSMETEMLIQAIEREPILLNFIVDKYKIQEILKKIFLTWNMLLICTRCKKFWKELLKK